MPFSRRQFAICILQFAVFNLLVSAAQACNVPVFRYALERWPADNYQLIVFHKGPLTPEEQKLVDTLAEHANRGECPPNFKLNLVDLSKPAGPEALKLFQQQRSPELPWLVVRYPEDAGIDEAVWSGRLNADTAQALMDSPARREVGKRLLQGDSAVWILLESGDKEKDDAAAKLALAEFDKAQGRLKLPELTDAPQDQLVLAGIPLKIAFSLVRVGRSDPAEQMLVRMLLGSEPDLKERKDPMLFPLFGRGRVLYALVGAGINEDNIQETAAFLVGACSCRVKRENPGVDLLMSTDWGKPAVADLPKEPKEPQLVDLSRFASPPPKSVRVGNVPEAPPSEGVPAAAAEVGSGWLRHVLLGGVAGLVMLAALVAGLFFLFRDMRRRHDHST
jgi:hypothetical protein